MRCSDLGIEASNEYRRDTVLSAGGIEFSGGFGIQNAPKNPKAWYQFGQRIVGWSRIAQIAVIELLQEHVVTVINGDTDSVKVLAAQDELDAIMGELGKLAQAIDDAKSKVCQRVKSSYPQYYDELAGIGHYVLEFESDSFCASWNKAYCTHDVDARDGKRHYHFTLAGVPTSRRTNAVCSFIGIDGLADRMEALGDTFEDVCNLLLGYNVTYANDVIRLNARSFPEWGATFFGRVTDYLGNTALVAEPQALALYPMAKTVNDTAEPENAANLAQAIENNPNVNGKQMIVTSKGAFDLGELV